jgi:hypothetical protein
VLPPISMMMHPRIWGDRAVSFVEAIHTGRVTLNVTNHREHIRVTSKTSFYAASNWSIENGRVVRCGAMCRCS